MSSEDKLKEQERLIQTLTTELEVKSQELKKAQEQHEFFVYSVSHDLRAPLTHIIGFLELLDARIHNLLDEKSIHFLSVVLAASKNLALMLHEIMEYSKIEKMPLNKSDINTNDLVLKITQETTTKNPNQKIIWNIHPLPEIKADLDTLTMVFEKLIDNAVKFSKKSEPSIVEIGVLKDVSKDKDKTQNQAKTIFYIKDNGVGLEEVGKRDFFRLFQKAHNDPEFLGVGAGLAFVKLIIEKHGGLVWTEPLKSGEHGTVFYFSIP